jgi:phosphate butyryltransferase
VKTFAQVIEQAGRRLKPDKPVIAIIGHDKDVLDLLPRLCHFTRPVLMGNTGSISARLVEGGLNPGDYEIFHHEDERDALAQSLRLVKENRVQILMEAGIAHDIFLQEALKTLHRRGAPTIPSHVSILEFPLSGKCTIITDAALNPAPSLKEKIAILNNALSVARSLGRTRPRIAALSAIEYVNPSIPSTLDAAILSKMGQRGQFGDCLVEGPLDIDCAVSKDACGRKGVQSEVTGEADIFLVSDAESGSCFVQFLGIFGNMRMTGLVVGLPAPAVLKGPVHDPYAALAGAAFASLMMRG